MQESNCASRKLFGSSSFFTRRILLVSWLAATATLAVFPLIFLILTFYAAPAQDDFCFAYANLHEGFARTVSIYYNSLVGRIVPLFVIQFPSAIARTFGISLLSAYSATLAACMIALLAGSAFAVARAFTDLASEVRIFLCAAFGVALIAATRSPVDLLYWLPAVACYALPGVVSIIIFGECVRALERKDGFSSHATVAMALGGLLAALCNEFTAMWLFGMLAASLLGRFYLGQNLQVDRHAWIAAAILIGWIIVVLAPGNGARLQATGGVRDVSFALAGALKSSLRDLRSFFESPPVLGWLAVVATVTMMDPQVRPTSYPLRSMVILAIAVAVLALLCCYFEYFAHLVSTGGSIVERAVNQALILLLFGITLSVSLLAKSLRNYLRLSLRRDIIVLPVILTGLVLISLSGEVSRLHAESNSFDAFRKESAARELFLTTSQETVVTVKKHFWKPSIIMNPHADIDQGTGCVALYYGKSKIIPTEATSP